MAPDLVSAVSLRSRKKKTVQEALVNLQWSADIRDDLTQQGFYDYFRLWDILQGVHLSPEVGCGIFGPPRLLVFILLNLLMTDC